VARRWCWRWFFRSLHSIKVEINDYNLCAIKLYERIGFRVVGRYAV
jgi:RimJ/RimL family protein N-acetyltransferase